MLKQCNKTSIDHQTPVLDCKDQQFTSCNAYSEVFGAEKTLCMDDNKLMELVNHCKTEKIWNVKLGIALTKIVQVKIINTWSNYGDVFCDIFGKLIVTEQNLV